MVVDSEITPNYKKYPKLVPSAPAQQPTGRPKRPLRVGYKIAQLADTESGIVRRQAPRRYVPTTRPRKVKRGREVARIAGMVLAIIVVFAAISRLSADLFTGELAIGAYTIVVLALRIPSRVTFLLASLAFISSGAQLGLVKGTQQAENAAVFAFLLLVAGTLSLMREAKQVSPTKRRQRRR